MTKIDLTTTFRVIAYDESGYGDNRSRDFPSEHETKALAYAQGLEARFHPVVMKTITMKPISIQIYPLDHSEPLATLTRVEI